MRRGERRNFFLLKSVNKSVRHCEISMSTNNVCTFRLRVRSFSDKNCFFVVFGIVATPILEAAFIFSFVFSRSAATAAAIVSSYTVLIDWFIAGNVASNRAIRIFKIRPYFVIQAHKESISYPTYFHFSIRDTVTHRALQTENGFRYNFFFPFSFTMVETDHGFLFILSFYCKKKNFHLPFSIKSIRNRILHETSAALKVI